MLVYSNKYTIYDDIEKYNLPEDKEYDFPYKYCSGLSKAMDDIVTLDMVVAL